MKKLLFFLCLLSLLSCEPKQNRAKVVGHIRSASKLATVEFVVTKIVFANKEKRVLFNTVGLKAASFLAHSEATIKAGIDMRKIREEDIEMKGKKINIKLPPIELINFSYPAEKFEPDEYYSEDNTRLNNFTPSELDELFRLAEQDIRENINFLGIVETAENKTILFMERLLANLGFDEIYIHFEKEERQQLAVDVPDTI